jgi:DNA-binding NarL/FixJ family response regulator
VSAAPVRVAVVDPHALFAESLVLALRQGDVPANSVIPHAGSSVSSLLRTVLATGAEIVMADVEAGRSSRDMLLVSELSSRGRQVVAVGAQMPEHLAGEALQAGARGTLSKTASLTEVLDVIRRLRMGLPILSRKERGRLVLAWREESKAQHELMARLDLLTSREEEVLGWLMTGQQVADIAKLRFVSQSTVRTQVKSILAKLHVSSQLSAVGMAHRVGWRPPEFDLEERASGL